MSTVYPELSARSRAGDLGLHLRSTGKSRHIIKSYRQAVRTLGAWLSDQDLSLDPEDITTDDLRAFQGYMLTPADDGGAGLRTGTVCTR